MYFYILKNYFQIVLSFITDIQIHAQLIVNEIWKGSEEKASNFLCLSKWTLIIPIGINYVGITEGEYPGCCNFKREKNQKGGEIKYFCYFRGLGECG